jgi:hypothetical protein
MIRRLIAWAQVWWVHYEIVRDCGVRPLLLLPATISYHRLVLRYEGNHAPGPASCPLCKRLEDDQAAWRARYLPFPPRRHA